jgi:Domain of unknown function (DUF4397)
MRRLVALPAVLAVVTFVVAVPVGTVAPGAIAADALVRVAHFSPDTAGVDVWVDGSRVLKNVGYDTVSDYVALPAGDHEFALRPAGAASTSKPALSANAALAPSTAYTIAGVGLNRDLRGQIFKDDLGAPLAGTAKVRVIDAAVGTAPIDVVLNGRATFGGVDFPTASKYAAVAPATYGVGVRISGGRSVLDVPSVVIGEGIIYSFAVIGGAGKPVQLVPVVDARGPAQVPVGGAGTGGGGTALVRVNRVQGTDAYLGYRPHHGRRPTR